jgi:hypothetical protein
MKQKKVFIILGAIAIVFLLFLFAVIMLVVKYLPRLTNKSNDPIVVEVTLCDENASNLCIVSFGANNLNRMVINFQLPNADYAPFYVKADNRGSVSVYSCDVTESAPTSVYCTGVRTPLGETIDLKAYTTDGDVLIARGTFLISAIALATPISLPTIPAADTEVYTPTAFSGDTPLTSTPTLTPTSVPETDTAYPNP